MPYNTHIAGHILLGDDDVVFGCAMLGEQYGEVLSADLDRGGNEVEIESNTGGLRALIIANPSFKLDLEVEFSADVTLPGEGAEIVFPLAEVRGRVLGIKPIWKSRASRQVAIKAGYWDSMAVYQIPPIIVSGASLEHRDGQFPYRGQINGLPFYGTAGSGAPQSYSDAGPPGAVDSPAVAPDADGTYVWCWWTPGYGWVVWSFVRDLGSSYSNGTEDFSTQGPFPPYPPTAADATWPAGMTVTAAGGANEGWAMPATTIGADGVSQTPL